MMPYSGSSGLSRKGMNGSRLAQRGFRGSNFPARGIGVWNNGNDLQGYYASRGIVNWGRLRVPESTLARGPEVNRCQGYSVTIPRQGKNACGPQCHPKKSY